MHRRLFRWKDKRKESLSPAHFLDVGNWQESRSSPLRPLFLLNLLALIVLGTAVSWWILYFTSWFPELGGLLALGGLLSWLAFVFRLVPADTGKALQERFASVLNSRLATCIILLAVMALWRLSAPYGSVRIEAHQASVPREALIYRSQPQNPVGLSGNGESNLLLAAGSEPWHLKISGYPAIAVPVTSRHRALLLFPQSFRRRLVLVAPSAQLIKDHAELPSGQNITLTATVRDGARRPVASLAIPDYTWFPFWIGCAGDVSPDDSARAELNAVRDAVADARKAPFLRLPESRPAWYCKTCSGLEDVERELPDQGEVELIMSREKVTFRTQTVSLIPQGGGFIQVVLLAVPPDM